VVVLSLSLCAATPAAAQGVPNNPSVDQYVESLPAADGDRVPEGSGGGSANLDPGTRAELSSSPEGEALERIASPALGAPKRKGKGNRDGMRTDLDASQGSKTAGED
jgi:hypothetical protein